MFTKMKEHVTRVTQRSEVSNQLAAFPRSPRQAGELCWIIMSQNLLSAIKVLGPEMVRSKDTGIYTRQAYWSLKKQKANDQANWKVNYVLNVDSEKRELGGTRDAHNANA